MNDTNSTNNSLGKNILLTVLKTITYLIVVVLGMVAGMGLMTILWQDSMASMTQSDFFDWRLLNIQYIGLAIGIVPSTLLYRYFVDDKNHHSLGLGGKGLGRGMAMGMNWAVGILLVAFLVVWLLQGVEVLQTKALDKGLLGYFSFFFLVAIVEEFVFRGYLLNMMAEHLTIPLAILLTSLGFALIHLSNDHFTWLSFCNLTLGGALMALLYFKYDSLYAPIGFHWLWNFFQGNILGFGVSGNEVLGLLQIAVKEPNWLSGGQFGLEGSVFTCILLGMAILYLCKELKILVHPNSFSGTIK